MLWLPIDKTSDTSLIKQVYHQIRSLILRGALKSGDKLPSTRELASHLNVSRNVILEAYEVLSAEGYLVSSLGSGTYIADGVLLAEQPKTQVSAPTEVTCQTDLKKSDLINFRSGIPDLGLLPRKKWSQLEQQICLDSPTDIFGYDAPEGRSELRATLCRYLRKSRGVDCQPDQIIVTSGAVQGLSILSRALLAPQKPYIIEDPIHCHIKNIFAFNSSNIHPVPVDESGLRTDLLPQINPALVMVTPSHQYPLGVILPIQRRIELIQYARSHECFIIEDDYDSEFRYEGLPISSLQGLEPNWTIYIGSFSKILFPALRLGYMVVPPVLIEQCRTLKELQDNHTPILTQLTLARFIEDGYLAKHLAKMKKVYLRKRNLLTANLQNAFPKHLIISGKSTGLHLIAEFEGISFTDQVIDLIKKTGVLIHPVAEHSIKTGLHTGKIIIGYSHLSEKEIEEGVTRLKKALLPLL